MKVSDRRRPTAAFPRGLVAWAALSRAASIAEQAAMGPKAKPSAEATETCTHASRTSSPLYYLERTSDITKPDPTCTQANQQHQMHGWLVDLRQPKA